VDLDNQCVSVLRLRPGQEKNQELDQLTISYDELVVALGATTAYFGVPGAAEYSVTLKSLADVKRIKNSIIELFETAQLEPEKERRRSLLTFVIVGGGPTGVELAGELSDLIRTELRLAYPDLWQLARVIIMEGSDRLVGQMGHYFSENTAAILTEKGNIDVQLRARCIAVQPDGVMMGESFIPAGLVVWTAGVQAVDLDIKAERPVAKDERSRRIVVDEYLRVPSYPNVFVAGDQALVEQRDSEQYYPMRAQFAVGEARAVARNILHSLAGEPLQAFHFNDSGFLLSLGKGGALAEVWGQDFRGSIAWLLYRVYLLKLVGARTRVRTGIEWLLNFFTPRDLSEL
jgi:NADH dehydrogenase